MNPPSRHIGRKIWYVTVIVLSALVLLLSAVGIVGGWIIKNKLSQASVALMQIVYTSAGSARQVTQLIDQAAGEVSQISSEVSQISLQISQNVADEGLIALMLPEEKESQLVAQISELREMLGTVRDALTASLELYRSIDSIPFVNLPGPSEEQIAAIEGLIIDTQENISAIRQDVQDFRAGVSEGIDRITQAADKITAGMDEVSTRMVSLDANLVALQDFAIQMQTTIPTVLTVLAVVVTLFLAYVIYTQVEVIRLYVLRWKSLKAPLFLPAQAEPAEPESPPAIE